jgi:hypothetical protein
MTWINARYAGRCRCGSRIILGDIINHDRRARAVVACRACKDKGCPKCEYTHPGAACTADGCPGRATGSISDRIRAAERATGTRFARPTV